MAFPPYIYKTRFPVLRIQQIPASAIPESLPDTLHELLLANCITHAQFPLRLAFYQALCRFWVIASYPCLPWPDPPSAQIFWNCAESVPVCDV